MKSTFQVTFQHFWRKVVASLVAVVSVVGLGGAWSSAYAEDWNGRDIMLSGGKLGENQSLRSLNGQYETRMQDDGNLVTYGPDGVVWAANLHRPQGEKEFVMQEDGNLVVYVDHQPIWATNTENTDANNVFLTNDGNLQVRHHEQILWEAPGRRPSNDVNAAEGKFNEFYDQTIGRPVCNHGYCECVALFNYYNENILGRGFIGVGHARELYGAAPDDLWEKLPSDATPRKGDVAVWGEGWPWSSSGHVAIVVEDQGDRIKVITQNPGNTNEASFTKQHTIGYLRPRL